MEDNWISVKERLPENCTKVRYKMKVKKRAFSYNTVEDIGLFSDGDFLTTDPIAIAEITHWKPL